MNTAIKIIFSLATLGSFVWLVVYFVKGLHASVHPSGVIATAFVMLIGEVLIYLAITRQNFT